MTTMNSTYDTPSGEPPAAEEARLVTLSEFANEIGVTVAAVTNWRSRFMHFPSPVDPHPKRLLYRHDELLAWAREHGRIAISPGRPSASPLQFLAHALGEQLDLLDGATDLGAAQLRLADTALAIAALRVLTTVRPELNTNDYDLLAPAIAAHSALASHGDTSAAASDAAQRITEALAELSQHAISDLRTTIDNLRTDYVRVAGQAAASESRDVWDLVQLMGRTAPVVADPLCGHGGLLTTAARAARDDGRTIRLIGQEIEPLRLAAALALMLAEEFEPELFVGDSSQKDSPIDLRLRDAGDALLVADLPLRTTRRIRDGHKPPTLDEWLHRVQEWLVNIGTETTAPEAAVSVPGQWLSKPSGSQTTMRDELLEDRWLQAVAVAPGQGTHKPIARHGVILLGVPAFSKRKLLLLNLSPSVTSDLGSISTAFATARQAVKDWRSGTAVSAEPVAVQIDRTELSASGYVLPPSYREVTNQDLMARHVRSAPDQRSLGDASGTDTDEVPARSVEVPRFPQRSMSALRDALERINSGQALPIELDPDQSLRDLVSGRSPSFNGPALEVVGANELPTRGEVKGIVTLVTSSADFGHVEIGTNSQQQLTAQRRGLVGFAVTSAGQIGGLTPEFIAGWLASVQVQQRLEQIVREGKTRHATSLDDLLSIQLPLGFPDQEMINLIAQRWSDYIELLSFAQGLPDALAIWKLHLATKPSR